MDQSSHISFMLFQLHLWFCTTPHSHETFVVTLFLIALSLLLLIYPLLPLLLLLLFILVLLGYCTRLMAAHDFNAMVQRTRTCCNVPLDGRRRLADEVGNGTPASNMASGTPFLTTAPTNWSFTSPFINTQTSQKRHLTRLENTRMKQYCHISHTQYQWLVFLTDRMCCWVEVWFSFRILSTSFASLRVLASPRDPMSLMYI